MLKKILHHLAKINFSISSLNNLKNNDEKSWEAIGDDPQLLLESRFFSKGWYFGKLKINYEDEIGQTAKLYPDYGEGYSESRSIFFPLNQTRPTHKVFYFPKKVEILRFDPVETEINFTIEDFKIYKIPQFKALKIIIKRISNLHPSYIQNSIKENKKLLIDQCKKKDWKKNILSVYEETFSASYDLVKYESWIDKEELIQDQEIASIMKGFKFKPLISILVPTYNTDPSFLKQCIESVQKQSYSNWQLCITDDASTQIKHLKVITQTVKKDSRIKFSQNNHNSHISETSNTCLSMATGEYILLLDHDDLLTEHTLLYFVDALQKNQDLELIYADEDKVDENGNRFDPHFKPEWNKDLLFSQNYIGHPVLYKTKALKEIGGFRVGVEGSQDHDLLLRYTVNLSASKIHRIPKILYQWRVHKDSTAGSADAKNYTTKAGIKALQDIFSKQEIKVQVDQGEYPNTYRIRWPVPKKQPLVSLIIPTYNGYEVLKTCIESILEKTTYKNFEVLILDNRTDCELTLNFIKTIEEKHQNVRSLKWDHPFNYSAINNFGASHANGTILGLINNDIEVITPDWLTEMVSHAIRPDIGCVGSKLYYPNNTIQHAGVILGIGGVAGHGHKFYDKDHPGYFVRLKLIQNLSAVTAACLVVRKEVFDQVNGLEESNLPVAFNDVDLCIRIREAGYRNLWTPYAELYHHESVSRGIDDTPEKQKRALEEVEYMKSTWGELLLKDPAYNPNLSLIYENFSLGK